MESSEALEQVRGEESHRTHTWSFRLGAIVSSILSEIDSLCLYLVLILYILCGPPSDEGEGMDCKGVAETTFMLITLEWHGYFRTTFVPSACQTGRFVNPHFLCSAIPNGG